MKIQVVLPWAKYLLLSKSSKFPSCQDSGLEIMTNSIFNFLNQVKYQFEYQKSTNSLSQMEYLKYYCIFGMGIKF